MEQNDLQQELDIQPGQLWLCRDGVTKARVYATDGQEPYPIHGAIQAQAGWAADTWTSAGLLVTEGGHPLDLIRRYDWREELAPIWAVLKPEYRWIARAAVGHWATYTGNEPPERDKTTFWGSGMGFGLNALRMPNPDCPWYETLTERPDQ